MSRHQVCPSPRDIKEMNFVLLGPAGSPYEGKSRHCVLASRHRVRVRPCPVPSPARPPYPTANASHPPSSSLSPSSPPGGFYHGIVDFPSEYPFKPPQIKMYTPSGRFEVDRPLCLSMTNFHPESWNPVRPRPSSSFTLSFCASAPVAVGCVAAAAV